MLGGGGFMSDFYPDSIKPVDSSKTPEYAEKLSPEVQLPIGRAFCCRYLAFVIYVPTEICTVHDVFEHLPEYILIKDRSE